MKIISMVPSWTETLIEAGVEVVGRTRFCIHPHDKVKSIPVVGGTKNIDWEKVGALGCDLLLLDQEENPKYFFEEANCPTHVTHVQNCNEVAGELAKLSKLTGNQNLVQLSQRWSQVVESLKSKQHLSNTKIPGLREWINKPAILPKEVVYVIWKDPYMAVVQETFIGSILNLLGLRTPITLATHSKLYPEIKIEDFDPQKTLFLFSSEPFPFHKKNHEIAHLNVPSAIVDGECFSWFGIRSLKFLESL